MITSIVNAASYGAPQLPSIAPGSIATIFGSNLANDTVAATSTPLPNQLGGTTVTVDGVPAPLFYVSPNQINFQLSWRYQKSNSDVSVNSTVAVNSPAGSSDPFTLGIHTFRPGIFAADGSGCGQGAILNVASDGGVSPNGLGNSVAPGGIVTFFVLGLGPPRTPHHRTGLNRLRTLPSRPSTGPTQTMGEPPQLTCGAAWPRG